MAFRFSFQPAALADVPMIHRWLEQDYVQKWIHGEGLANTLTDLDSFALNKPACFNHWIAFEKGVPFSYLLTSVIQLPDDFFSRYCKLGQQAITLDVFIGNPDFLGKGLSVPMIQEFLIGHYSHVDAVYIDPELANSRAVHVYQKAGFRILDQFIASWHPVPHYLMLLQKTHGKFPFNRFEEKF